MIPRYENKEITNIWSDKNKFTYFFQIELELLKALENQNLIPKNISTHIEKNTQINPERILEIEQTTYHDVIAFCSSITEQCPPELGKYFHYGVTSSDIIDTALSLQIKDSLIIVIHKLETFLTTLKMRAIETKDIITFGRSHGIYAEPMSFGQKILGHYSEIKRRHTDLKLFFENELTMQLSGAVGNYTVLSPEIELIVAKKLKLKVETVSTQIIPRDRIAKLISITSLLANAIERLAVEVRHLHHSDVNEVSEGFKKGQKGSSTMPHKKNPISTENLTGLSRFLRSHLSLALENSILWHERDISHSSAERLYLPDHFGILCYILERFNSTMLNLEIHQNRIEEKVNSRAHYLSSYYLHYLIQNCPNLTREKIYSVVQQVSFQLENENTFHNFHKLLEKELNIALPVISAENLKSIFLKHVDTVFKRAIED
jgi:adenylosuccinate lyase